LADKIITFGSYKVRPESFLVISSMMSAISLVAYKHSISQHIFGSSVISNCLTMTVLEMKCNTPLKCMFSFCIYLVTVYVIAALVSNFHEWM